MNINLPFVDQMRALRIRSQPQNPGDAVSSAQQAGGGFIAQSFTDLVASILAGYHTQHNTDDTHATITASGSISERKRTTPIGVWIAAPFNNLNFTAPSGSNWDVKQTQLRVLKYMLVGTTLTLAWYIEASTVSGTAAASLSLLLPASAISVGQQFGTCAYDDNGTKGLGVVFVAGGTNMVFAKDVRLSSTFSASGNLSLFGTFPIEIKATL